jgi:hypothetical protein
MPLKLTRLEKLRRIRANCKVAGFNIWYCWSEKRKSGVQRLKYRGSPKSWSAFGAGRATLMGCIYTMFPKAVLIINERPAIHQIDIVIETK